MEIMINDDNLEMSDVQEFRTKVRALLFDEEGRILIANYGDVILLPGGKAKKGESLFSAILSELNEELGEEYKSEELSFFLTLNYCQRDYPKREGIFLNRMVQTHYFLGEYKGVEKDLQKLSDKEKKDNFRLELIALEDLEVLLLNRNSENPRNIYFKKELLTVLDYYKKVAQDTDAKKLELK